VGDIPERSYGYHPAPASMPLAWGYVHTSEKFSRVAVAAAAAAAAAEAATAVVEEAMAETAAGTEEREAAVEEEGEAREAEAAAAATGAAAATEVERKGEQVALTVMEGEAPCVGLCGQQPPTGSVSRQRVLARASQNVPTSLFNRSLATCWTAPCPYLYHRHKAVPAWTGNRHRAVAGPTTPTHLAAGTRLAPPRT
jgi:hypothetical protein